MFSPSKSYFIKLGSNGIWEQECIEKSNTIKVGFRGIDDHLCKENKWDEVKNIFKNNPKLVKSATLYTNQLQKFYEANDSVLWITFYKQKLWWCFANKEVSCDSENRKIKKVIKKWSDQDLKGNILYIDKLSGELVKVQAYRSTICEIKASDYLILKIRGDVTKDVHEAIEARQNLENKIGKLVKKLTWRDFEILIDLIFTNSGFKRISEVGGKQKSIDIVFQSPVSNERYFVQVKSASEKELFESFMHNISEQEFDKFYYVVHSPSEDLAKCGFIDDDRVRLIQVEDIAKLTVKTGLSDWLINKVG